MTTETTGPSSESLSIYYRSTHAYGISIHSMREACERLSSGTDYGINRWRSVLECSPIEKH